MENNDSILYNDEKEKLRSRVPKRKAKDSVFRGLFSRPEYLLQLYRAVHPEDTEATQKDLGNVTIENVLIDSCYNDLGFTVRDRALIMVEAQSTWSENITVRILLYLAETWSRQIKHNKQDVYRKETIQLPVPEFYVIYTGTRRNPPEWISMADSFFGGDRSRLELRARVLNGGGTTIVDQYIEFCREFDRQIGKWGRTPTAISQTIRICIRKGILMEYLEAHEEEVTNSMSILFDQEYVTEVYGLEQRKKGRAEGRAEGRAQTEAELMDKMIARGDSDSDIMELLSVTAQQIAGARSRMGKQD